MLTMFEQQIVKKKFFPGLQDFLTEHSVKAELIKLDVPMKTASSAATELKISEDNIFKSVLLSHKTTKNLRVYALIILRGNDKINIAKVSEILDWNNKKVSFASPKEVLEQTGFIAGGTPPIGHKEKFPVILDKNLLKYEVGYGGGGSPELLLKISPTDIVQVTNAIVSPIGTMNEPENRLTF